MLIAERGFSMLVTVAKAGREHRFLFDAGTSPNSVADNMRRLDIDPSSIEAIVCSHGHFDHTTGIDGLIRAIGRVNMPVLLHPHFWRQRRLQLPGREPQELPATSRRALTEAGFDIIEEREPSFLFGRSVLITGEVARTTGYEPGLPPQQAWLDGRWQPDPLVLDDQALIINVRDRGLMVITGCGHAGVVNIARYAQRLTGGQPLYALLGGFHLGGPLFEPLIPRVLDDLAALNPGVLVPAHAPAGARSTRCRPGFPPPSSRTRSALASTCDYSPPNPRRCMPTAPAAVTSRIRSGRRAWSQSSSRSAAEPDPKYLASSSTAATSAAAASSVSSKSGSS